MVSRALLEDDRRNEGVLEHLLLRSGRGDAAAFGDLYDHLAPRVFGLVTRLVPDPAAAEAVTCEAFVDSWRRSASYDPERCGAAVWVLVIAHGLAVRAARA